MSDIVFHTSEVVFAVVLVVIVIEDSRKKLGSTVTICSLSEPYSFEDSVTRVYVIRLVSVEPRYIREFLFKDIFTIQRCILDHKRYDLVVRVFIIPPFTDDIDSCRYVCSHIRIPVATLCSECCKLPPFVFCKFTSYEARKCRHRSI